MEIFYTLYFARDNVVYKDRVYKKILIPWEKKICKGGELDAQAESMSYQIIEKIGKSAAA